MQPIAAATTVTTWPSVDIRWIIVIAAGLAIAMLLRRDDKWTNPVAGAIALATFLVFALF